MAQKKAMALAILIAALFNCGVLVDRAEAVAQFETEKVTKHGVWNATLFRNVDGNRLFCAAGTSDGDTILRINRYRASGETFLEVFNSKWTMMEGSVQFSFEFNMGTENYTAELRGKSWGDSYTYDFTDVNNYNLFLGLLTKAKSFEVKNANGATISKFSGTGSREAIINYIACLAA